MVLNATSMSGLYQEVSPYFHGCKMFHSLLSICSLSPQCLDLFSNLPQEMLVKLYLTWIQQMGMSRKSVDSLICTGTEGDKRILEFMMTQTPLLAADQYEREKYICHYGTFEWLIAMHLFIALLLALVIGRRSSSISADLD